MSIDYSRLLKILKSLILLWFGKVWVAGVLLAGLSPVAAAHMQNEMLGKYQNFIQGQSDNSLPFTLASTDRRGVISASVRTFLPGISYSQFVEQLSKVEEWCEFVPLHLNVKACFYEKGEDTKLGFFVGVKGYLNPTQASLLLLDFNARVDEEVLLIGFSAEDGPYDSSNYDFKIRAIGVDDGVYLEFDLSSVPGYVSSLANIYFLTVARNKIGFSVKGKTWTGKTKYVGGQRGAAERNVVRYLLAIQTYFETLDVPEAQRYEERLERWFAATQKYKRQLYEMDQETYLSIKRRERKNQFILMEARRNNVKPVYEPEIQKAR